MVFETPRRRERVRLFGHPLCVGVRQVCLVLAAKRPGYMSVAFARPYDLKMGSIGDRLRTVEPTVFLGVPRVWEKIAEKMKAVGKSTKGLKKVTLTLNPTP